jgi:hypothetical protein
MRPGRWSRCWSSARPGCGSLSASLSDFPRDGRPSSRPWWPLSPWRWCSLSSTPRLAISGLRNANWTRFCWLCLALTTRCSPSSTLRTKNYEPLAAPLSGQALRATELVGAIVLGLEPANACADIASRCELPAVSNPRSRRFRVRTGLLGGAWESHLLLSPGVVVPSLAVASRSRNGPTRSPSWAGCRKMLSGFTL